MHQKTSPSRRKWLQDMLLLLGAALLLATLGVGTFLLAEAYHISSNWLMLGWVSAGFFAAVGWDYRAKFRSIPFVLFFCAWLVLNGVIFVFVIGKFGWLYWLAAMAVELFFFYFSAYLLFGPQPPSKNDN